MNILAQTVAQNPSWFDAGDALIRALEDRNHLIVIALIFLGIILKRIEISGRLIAVTLLIVGIVAGAALIPPVQEGVLRGVCYAGISSLLYEMVVRHIVAWAEKKFGKDDSEPPPPPQSPPLTPPMFPPRQNL